MDQDSGPRRSPNGPFPPAESRDGVGEGSADRLPPPMFPPGSRRRAGRPSPGVASNAEGRSAEIPQEAFISPDEPIRTRGASGDGGSRELEDSGMDESAFISPDEPIVRTERPHPPEDYEQVLGAWTMDEVEVTGIGEPHLNDEDLRALERFGDPHVADLFRALDRLTDAVRAKGQAGLKTSADMTPFEISLRSYCVGYLAGRREEP